MWVVGALAALIVLQPSATDLVSHLRAQGSQLDLRGTGVTDDELEQLCEPAFRGVSALLLARTKVGDPGLAALSCLRLRELDLQGTRVTDAGLQSLAGRALWRSGDRDGARAAWRDGAATNKFNPWAKRCAEVLSQVDAGGEPPR